MGIRQFIGLTKGFARGARKLVPYAWLGQLNVGNLTAALIFAPLAPLGIWLGLWLHRHISDRAFYQVSYALLFGTGVKLILDAFAG